MELDDVHGRHGESSAVDHASDFSVKANVVEIPLARRDLPRIDLGVVLEREELLLPEGGVVVEPELGVGGDEVPLWILGQGVDLHHGAVAVEEEVVEAADLVGGGGLVAADLEAGHDLGDLVVRDAGVDVDGDLDDLVGKLLGEIFDARAALAARDDERTAAASVQEDGKVLFVLELHLLRDVEAVDGLALRSRLLRDENLADHLLGEALDLLRFADVDASLEAVLEGAQAATSRENLALHDDLRSEARERERERERCQFT